MKNSFEIGDNVVVKNDNYDYIKIYKGYRGVIVYLEDKSQTIEVEFGEDLWNVWFIQSGDLCKAVEPFDVFVGILCSK